MSIEWNKHDCYWAIGTLIILLIITISALLIVATSNPPEPIVYYEQNQPCETVCNGHLLNTQEKVGQRNNPVTVQPRATRNFGTTISSNLTGIISCSVTLASLVLSLVAIGSTLLQGTDNAKFAETAKLNQQAHQNVIQQISQLLEIISERYIKGDKIIKQIKVISNQVDTSEDMQDVEDLKKRLEEIQGTIKDSLDNI